MANEYDNNMQVILSKVVSDNPNAPYMRIRFEMDGKFYKAGLWPMKRTDGSKVTDKQGNALYKGMIEADTYAQERAQAPSGVSGGYRDAKQGTQAKAAPAAPDEDVPF